MKPLRADITRHRSLRVNVDSENCTTTLRPDLRLFYQDSSAYYAMFIDLGHLFASSRATVSSMATPVVVIGMEGPEMSQGLCAASVDVQDDA